MEKNNLNNLRQNYDQRSLSIKDTLNDGIEQFKAWFEEAKNSDIKEPNAMTLATVNAENIPSIRTVLMKDWDNDGIIFYTNYGSTKANDIEVNNKVAICFLWLPLERQVRIKGMASKTSKSKSEEYFSKRPRKSQIGAWCSPQSQIIESRSILEKEKEKIETKFEGKNIPVPDNWGGYYIKIYEIEFWQGRPGRLHDRIKYTKENNTWNKVRLAP